MIDFPNSPTVGQVVSSPNGTAWRWTGSTWVLGTAASAGGARGTVAYAEVRTQQTGITSALTEIAGLTVTWTASPERTYRVSVFCPAIRSTVSTDTVNTIIWVPSGAQSAGAMTPVSSTGATGHTLTMSVVLTGLSGSQTRGVAVLRGGTGTVTWIGSFQDPSYILVEDITYDAGPGGSAHTPL